MNAIKWLYPGLKIKRWLGLAFVGMFLTGIGLALVVAPRLIALLPTAKRFLGSGQTAPLAGGIILMLLGTFLFLTGFRRMVRSILAVMLPQNEGPIVEVVYQKRHLQKGPRIVAIGGGTGLSVLLRGLKNYTSNLTAIVTVSDDGGSSGRLRGELGILPPGDTRNCLVALADTESLMEKLINYRFDQGKGLAGHSLGNLLLAALTDITGGFDKAVKEIGKVLALRGRVLPSTLDNVVLCAELEDGTIVEGETRISSSRGRIRKVFLKPPDVAPLKEAIEAIEQADAVVLGPGSLYTSVLPNLLVRGLREALERTKAPIFYVCNVMTQPGETTGYTAYDHLKALVDHCGPGLVDYVVVNVAPIPRKLLARYREQGAYPVRVNRAALARQGVKVMEERLIDKSNLIRHDPDKLARCIIRQVLAGRNPAARLKILEHYLAERIREAKG
ncbi:gluconeogenesis factor YvcK family protein [Calderihabitans maritimus]|uniref:Putative gluconeogenesis factor n=1 Tax=Calderihabitans maritimus TaxID=1246530 RepID=A0A1Z5HV19_9FIRM|nr:gluconeogenesis factor YvcK family protein [Calderihabitans maritimus]GAW93185.1 hypothetical protein KKC1_23250 [Calderihabitans maritimus]